MEKTMEKKVTKSIIGQHQIKTNLIGKSEVFKILAVAKAMHTSTLLLGSPGTGKTACVLDFAKSYFDGDEKKAIEGTFILETDEGTKSSEVKGNLDVEKLVMDNKFALCTPITEASFVVINEVDKASSGVRNAMLGVMNEKILFNGKEKIPCKWEVFVGTANEIPKEEVNSPFWDRFMIKFRVDRVSAGEMLKYFKGSDKSYSNVVTIANPSEEDINNVEIDIDKLEIFISHVRKDVTDRTLSFVPRLTKVVSLIYNKGIDSALVKVAELLTNNLGLAQELNKKLAPKEKREILDKIDLLPAINDEPQLKRSIDEIEELIGKYEKSKKLEGKDLDECMKQLETIVKQHPILEFSGFADED